MAYIMRDVYGYKGWKIYETFGGEKMPTSELFTSRKEAEKLLKNMRATRKLLKKYSKRTVFQNRWVVKDKTYSTGQWHWGITPAGERALNR